MPSIELQAIVPKDAFKSRAFVDEIEKVLHDEVRELDRLYKQTYATWDKKPIMHREVKIGTREAHAEVSTDDKKMLWLDDGTKKPRHALMSSSSHPAGLWKSKTKPNRLRSGSGRGKLVRVSRQIQKPGIKPRNWSIIIAKLREQAFQRNADAAIKRAKI